MSFQILDIVLYGPPEAPRIVSLNPGRLNVITGLSKRGKSALVPIIEYCLGSGECKVAFGPIRDTVEWYGLRLQMPDKQVFVARQAPKKGQQTNSAVYLEMAAEVSIPNKTGLSATTNVDTARDVVSRTMGIADNVHQPVPGQTREPATANIGSSLFFCFQPQYEIINPKTLFHRQSEGFYIPQLIQDVLPYFLGAVTDDHLVKLARMRSLRLDKRRLEQSLAEAKSIAGAGASRAMALLSEARDVGLVGATAQEMSLEDARNALQQVLNREIAPVAQDVSTDEYERLLQLREEQTGQVRRLDADRQAVTALINERHGYAAEGAEHVSRLKTLGLYETIAPHATCPLCANELASFPNDGVLSMALRDLQGKLTNVNQDNPHLEQLASRIEEQAAKARATLADTRQAMSQIERSRQQLANYRDFIARVAHVRGRISIYLEAVPAQAASLDDLGGRIAALDAEIETLDQELSRAAVEERLESILSVVSGQITKAGRELDLEHSEHPLRFSIKKLTVIADTPTGPIPMERMGSGANWVGYHIAVHLALHQQFVAGDRPVPRFLILDQPSQVYFPADRDVEGKLEVGREGRALDEDRAAVLKMFTLLRDAVDEMGGQFQVLVTEHADPNVPWFQEAIVEKWQEDDKALIPREWIDKARDDS